jgi:hypothetical protein
MRRGASRSAPRALRRVPPALAATDSVRRGTARIGAHLDLDLLRLRQRRLPDAAPDAPPGTAAWALTVSFPAASREQRSASAGVRVSHDAMLDALSRILGFTCDSKQSRVRASAISGASEGVGAVVDCERKHLTRRRFLCRCLDWSDVLSPRRRAVISTPSGQYDGARPRLSRQSLRDGPCRTLLPHQRAHARRAASTRAHPTDGSATTSRSDATAPRQRRSVRLEEVGHPSRVRAAVTRGGHVWMRYCGSSSALASAGRRAS